MAVLREDDVQFLGSLSSADEDPWRIKVQVDGMPVTFKIDTGADTTAMPERLYRQKFLQHKLHRTYKTLFGPDKTPLKVLGSLRCEIRIKKACSVEDIYVVKELETPLLGKPAITSLSILKLLAPISDPSSKSEVNPIREFRAVFHGLGKAKGEYNIILKPDAIPFSLHTPRRVPIPLLKRIKEGLQRMVKQQVIVPVEEPTSWCAAMVIVPNKGSTDI